AVVVTTDAPRLKEKDRGRAVHDTTVKKKLCKRNGSRHPRGDGRDAFRGSRPSRAMRLVGRGPDEAVRAAHPRPLAGGPRRPCRRRPSARGSETSGAFVAAPAPAHGRSGPSVPPSDRGCLHVAGVALWPGIQGPTSAISNPPPDATM